MIERGSQVSAAMALITGRNILVSGIAAIHINLNEQTRSLRSNYPVFIAWQESA